MKLAIFNLAVVGWNCRSALAQIAEGRDWHFAAVIGVLGLVAGSVGALSLERT